MMEKGAGSYLNEKLCSMDLRSPQGSELTRPLMSWLCQGLAVNLLRTGSFGITG